MYQAKQHRHLLFLVTPLPSLFASSLGSSLSQSLTLHIYLICFFLFHNVNLPNTLSIVENVYIEKRDQEVGELIKQDTKQSKLNTMN